jgi:hypothetical protein
VGVKCPEGGGSAAPIYITAIAVALLSLAGGLLFLIPRAKRRQREDLEARMAAIGQALGQPKR